MSGVLRGCSEGAERVSKAGMDTKLKVRQNLLNGRSRRVLLSFNPGGKSE